MRRLFLALLLWAVIAVLLAPRVASEDDSVDGFDDASEGALIKTATDISSVNLNPFQVEVFVSHCMQ